VSCTKYERVSHILLPVSRIKKLLSYNVVNYYAAIINFLSTVLLFKNIVFIWFRCRLTESEIIGIRRLSVLL